MQIALVILIFVLIASVGFGSGYFLAYPLVMILALLSACAIVLLKKELTACNGTSGGIPTGFTIIAVGCFLCGLGVGILTDLFILWSLSFDWLLINSLFRR